jgi:two-component system, NarL family, captular synthesis response regulator RcsB
MFKKVLIAEDHESSNISIRKALEDFGCLNNDYVYYCDDALKRINHALKTGNEYDLLITDLSFEEDEIPQTIGTGTELIKAVKELQPNIKVLVFSAESKGAIIDNLFKEFNINAFVRKARRDVTELKQAFDAICNQKTYLSASLRRSIQYSNAYEFKEFDIILISLLSKGVLQKDIPTHLQEKKIKPSGLSSVEKRLNYMKEVLSFNNNEQLIAFCKDIGVI